MLRRSRGTVQSDRLRCPTLGAFVPFAVFYMRQPLKWDYLWAALCIVGAVYFMFRGGTGNVPQ